MAENETKDTFSVLDRVKYAHQVGTVVGRGLGFDAYRVLWDNGAAMNMFGWELERCNG